MKQSLSIAAIVAAVVLAACNGGSSTPGAVSTITPAHIISGGSGLNVSPGACIASGALATTALEGLNAPVSVTVLSKGAHAFSYVLEDTLGNSITASAGYTVTIDGATVTLLTPSPKVGTRQAFTIQPAY